MKKEKVVFAVARSHPFSIWGAIWKVTLLTLVALMLYRSPLYGEFLGTLKQDLAADHHSTFKKKDDDSKKERHKHKKSRKKYASSSSEFWGKSQQLDVSGATARRFVHAIVPHLSRSDQHMIEEFLHDRQAFNSSHIWWQYLFVPAATIVKTLLFHPKREVRKAMRAFVNEKLTEEKHFFRQVKEALRHGRIPLPFYTAKEFFSVLLTAPFSHLNPAWKKVKSRDPQSLFPHYDTGQGFYNPARSLAFLVFMVRAAFLKQHFHKRLWGHDMKTFLQHLAQQEMRF